MKKKQTSLFVAFVQRFRRRRFTLLYVFLSVVPSLLHSQNLDDFKTAASGDGVHLIPFSELRKEAFSIADDVQDRKEEVQSFHYDVAEKEKDNLLKEIKKKNDEIKEIKDLMEELTKKGIDMNSYKADIEKREKEIEVVNGKVKDMNEKLEKAAETFGRLYDLRAVLREYFEKTVRQLSDAKSNPERHLGSSPSDEDKKKLEEYIRTIEDKIQAGVREHKVQEDAAKETKEKYEKLIKKTEL